MTDYDDDLREIFCGPGTPMHKAAVFEDGRYVCACGYKLPDKPLSGVDGSARLRLQFREIGKSILGAFDGARRKAGR